MEPERPWSLESLVAETRGDVRQVQIDVTRLRTDVTEVRADVRHLQADVGEIRHDIRRLDDRFFQFMLLQLGTLIAALASVVTAILT